MSIPVTPVDSITPEKLASHFHIVLDQPEIPPNTGTIARLCAGTNTLLHLVEPIAFQLDDKQLKRAGLDYWPNVTLIVHPNFQSVENLFPTQNLFLFTTKTTRIYTEVKYKLGDALVFGRETKGICEELRTKYESQCVTLPINKNHIRSLNLANSASIGLYEALRQVQYAPLQFCE